MIEQERIDVNTPIGTISATLSGDPEYPGVWVEVNGHELVLVEYDESVKRHVVRVWDHQTPNDDIVYKQTIEHSI